MSGRLGLRGQLWTGRDQLKVARRLRCKDRYRLTRRDLSIHPRAIGSNPRARLINPRTQQLMWLAAQPDPTARQAAELERRRDTLLASQERARRKLSVNSQREAAQRARERRMEHEMWNDLAYEAEQAFFARQTTVCVIERQADGIVTIDAAWDVGPDDEPDAGEDEPP